MGSGMGPAFSILPYDLVGIPTQKGAIIDSACPNRAIGQRDCGGQGPEPLRPPDSFTWLPSHLADVSVCLVHAVDKVLHHHENMVETIVYWEQGILIGLYCGWTNSVRTT